MRATRVVLTALSTSCALGLAATPAQAEQAVHVDAARDTFVYLYDSESGYQSFTRDPDTADTDILRVRFAFERNNVVVVGKVRQLDPRTKAGVSVGAGGQLYEFKATPTGHVRVLVEGEESRCVGGSFETRREARAYKFVIPVDCIGSPDRARFGFGLVRFAFKGNVKRMFLDDAHRNGLRQSPRHFRLGEFVNRG